MRRLAQRWTGRAIALALVAGGLYLLLTLARPAPVTVTWQTGSESDTAGFNVWRSEPGAPIDVPIHKVNGALIPARGNALAGADYTIEDTATVPGETYVYQIEEIDATGRGRRHPDTVSATAGWPRAWVVAEALVVIVVGTFLLALERRRHGPGTDIEP